MGALEIVVPHEAIQITLDFLGADVPSLPSIHSEALIEQRAVHPLFEAVGALPMRCAQRSIAAAR